MAARPSVDHDVVGWVRERLKRASPNLLREMVRWLLRRREKRKGAVFFPSANNKQSVGAGDDFPVQNGKARFELALTAVFQPKCSPPMTLVFGPITITVSGDSFAGSVALTGPGGVGMLAPHVADSAGCRPGSFSLGVRGLPVPALAAQMLTRAVEAGVPAAWVASDEVYGADPNLRATVRAHGLGYVLQIAANRRVPTHAGPIPG